MRCISILSQSLCATLVCLPSCGALEGENPFATKLTSFHGVEGVKPIGTGGKYLVTWSSSSVADTMYRVYSRRSVNPDYDFTSPLVTTRDAEYETEDLRAYGRVCFLVRREIPGHADDVNLREICTSEEASEPFFAGLTGLRRNQNASYTLTWQALVNSNISYQIFLRNDDFVYDFTMPWAVEISDSWVSDVIPLGENRCFVVRYTGEDLLPDENAIELCTEESSLGEFAGITSATSTQVGETVVSWNRTTHPDIVEYRIYQGSDFRSLIATASSDSDTITLTELGENSFYLLAVRAVDSLGREDENVLTQSVTVMCGESCNVAPARPAAPVLTLIEGNTTALCTASYATVDADGTTVTPTFRFYNSKAPSIARVTVTRDPGVFTSTYVLQTDSAEPADNDLSGDSLYCEVSVEDEYTSSTSSPSAFAIVP